MKKYIYITLVLCSIPLVLFHSRNTRDMAEAVKKSSITGTGIVESVEQSGARCSSTVTAEIKVLKILKGSLQGKPLRIQVTDYYWKKAEWPWQEDCPSVHYSVPPIEIKMEQGERIVFAADHFKGYGECYVTAAAVYERLDEVKRMAGLH